MSQRVLLWLITEPERIAAAAARWLQVRREGKSTHRGRVGVAVKVAGGVVRYLDELTIGSVWPSTSERQRSLTSGPSP